MILKNKINLQNSVELAIKEERISKKKALELFDKDLLDKLSPGLFSLLQFIHNYLYEDIYNFASKIRTVNIAKGNFRFSSIMYLEQAISTIEKIPQNTFDEIIEKYIEMAEAVVFS